MNFKETEYGEEGLQRQKEREEAKIAEEVTADFLRRREERRAVESGWLLNINFLSGNQYCDVSPFGGITEEDKQFYWQSRRVFNHIAPTIDSRIAKLEKMKPVFGRGRGREGGEIGDGDTQIRARSHRLERAFFESNELVRSLWLRVFQNRLGRARWQAGSR